MTDDAARLVVGRYRLRELLGQGGMGAVWRAHDEALDREVAVKQLTWPEHLGAEKRAGLTARMQREARAAAKLNHPGIITVHDQFVDGDGRPWIVMEIVHGESLDDLLQAKGRLPVQEVARIGMLMLAALGAAHAAGITHRDVKPANVLLEGDRVVLTDFGIAAVEGDATLTATGAVLGTPAYMSPEQVDGRPGTPASDLWSLGATLYTAVEGRRPFEAPVHAALYVAILTRHPAPPVHAGPLVPVLEGLLRKDPAERAATAQTAMRRLTELAADRTPGPWQAPAARPGRGPVPAPWPAGDRTGAPPAPWTTAPPAGRRRSSRRGPLLLLLALFVVALIVVSAVGVHRLWLDRDPRRIAQLNGHTGAVVTAAFSPDGTVLATAGEGEGSVRLWDVRTRKQLGAPLPGRPGTVNAAAFSPDGALLATGDSAGALRLWDVRARKPAGAPLLDGDETIRAAAFSPDGTVLAAGDAAGGVRLWDVRTRRRIAELPRGDEEHGQMTIAFGADGKTLVTADTKSARTWDLRTRRPIGEPLTGQDDHITYSVALGPGGAVLATGDSDGVRLWDVRTRKQLGRPLTGRGHSIQAVAFSRDGGILATGGDEPEARLWNVRTQRTAGEPLDDHIRDVYSVAFSPDGALLATGGGAVDDSAAVQLWSVS